MVNLLDTQLYIFRCFLAGHVAHTAKNVQILILIKYKAILIVHIHNITTKLVSQYSCDMLTQLLLCINLACFIRIQLQAKDNGNVCTLVRPLSGGLGHHVPPLLFI